MLACVLTKTSHHQVGACQVGVQLTLVKTSQLVHQLGTPVGITHQSARVLLSPPQVTKCQLVGVDGSVRASCLPLHVDLSLAVTNLFVVVESDISSASRVTAHVSQFTLVTGKSILVSVTAVTCHKVLVLIVGTFVLVPLVVYAV